MPNWEQAKKLHQTEGRTHQQPNNGWQNPSGQSTAMSKVTWLNLPTGHNGTGTHKRLRQATNAEAARDLP